VKGLDNRLFRQGQVMVEIIEIVFVTVPEVRAEDEHAATRLQGRGDGPQDGEHLVAGSAMFEKVAHESRVKVRGWDSNGKVLGGDLVHDDLRGGIPARFGIEVDGDPLSGGDLVDEVAIARTDLQDPSAARWPSIFAGKRCR